MMNITLKTVIRSFPRGALKGTKLRWEREPKTQIFAENRRFSQIRPFSWKSKLLEGAENRKFLQKTEDFRRKPQFGLRHLRSSPEARPYSYSGASSHTGNWFLGFLPSRPPILVAGGSGSCSTMSKHERVRRARMREQDAKQKGLTKPKDGTNSTHKSSERFDGITR